MSVLLMVDRSVGLDSDSDSEWDISLHEWLQLIDSDESLRLCTEPNEWTNSVRGMVFSQSAIPGQSEIELEGEFVPFLYYDNGRLAMPWISEFQDPTNPLRLKVAEIARKFNAGIRHDAGDDIIEW